MLERCGNLPEKDTFETICSFANDTGMRTENANRPRFTGSLTPERFNPLPKNPIIADFFANIGLADTLGSGTRNLFKYSWAYGGGSPSLTEGDVFVALVPLRAENSKGTTIPLDVDSAIVRMIETSGYATVANIASVTGVTQRTVRRHISLLVSEGKLKAEGSTRDRRYVRAQTV